MLGRRTGMKSTTPATFTLHQMIKWSDGSNGMVVHVAPNAAVVRSLTTGGLLVVDCHNEPRGWYGREDLTIAIDRAQKEVAS